MRRRLGDKRPLTLQNFLSMWNSAKPGTGFMLHTPKPGIWQLHLSTGEIHAVDGRAAPAIRKWMEEQPGNRDQPDPHVVKPPQWVEDIVNWKC